jgi:hypothetical protein
MKAMIKGTTDPILVVHQKKEAYGYPAGTIHIASGGKIYDGHMAAESFELVVYPDGTMEVVGGASHEGVILAEGDDLR